jgi:uncharacterized protein (UPF0276 family)
MTNSPLFKNYGIGVGLRPIHFPTFLAADTRPPAVEWVEVISENAMRGQHFQNTPAYQNLLKIREILPVVLHGVSMNLGASQPLNRDYLKSLKALIDRVQPIAISDHLCWTHAHGVQTHDLNPLPYTPEMVKWVAQKIIQAQDFLGRRLLIENVSSYVSFSASVLRESEFLSAVATAADCGILLDLNNVYVNCVNNGLDAKKYLAELPHARVGQLHLAGHSELNGFLIDTHDQPICDEVWQLYRWYGENFGHPSSMVERDAKIPAWVELELEVLKMKSLFLPEPLIISEQRFISEPKVESVRFDQAKMSEFEQQWIHSLLGDYTVTGILDQAPRTALERFEIYENAFWGRLEETIQNYFPNFRKQVEATGGSAAWDQLFFQCLKKYPPTSWTLTEFSENFLTALREVNHADFSLAEQDWARAKARMLSQAPLPVDAHTEFESLAEIGDSQLAKLKLLLHPSAQILFEQQKVFWNDRQAQEKALSLIECDGLAAVAQGNSLLDLSAYEEFLPAWVASGLVRGWKEID